MTHSISLFFGRNKPKHTKHVPDHDPPALGRHNSWSARWQQRRCHFQPHTYLLRPNTQCILQSFFFFLTPLVLRIVPGREQPCLGNGGILSFEGKKRYILKSNSLSKSKKSAPLQALEVGLKGQASVTLRKKAFFFSSVVTDVTKRTNRKIDMVKERTASTHLLRRLAFQTGTMEAAKHGQPSQSARNKTVHSGGLSPRCVGGGGEKRSMKNKA